MSTAAHTKFACASSTRPEIGAALDHALGELTDRLDAPVDLAFAFISSHFAHQLDDHAGRFAEVLATENVLGCTAESIICQGREYELEPAVSLWAGSLPGLDVVPFHLDFDPSADGGAFVGWPDELLGEWPDDAVLLALADPFSFPADVLLARMNDDRPGVPVMGGMASGGNQPGDCQLLIGRRLTQHGCGLVRLSGNLSVNSIVSQGCRPIGEPLVITASERNVIKELGGRSALEQIQRIYVQLPTSEQRLVQRGLHIGRLVDEQTTDPASRNYLIRNVIGVDESTQSISVGDFVRNGQTIQFHIRDGETARADLQLLLSQRARAARGRVLGGLSFSCNGRGTRLFDKRHHDARLIQDFFGPLPLAGFFAAGELGPIAGKNFVHGFTNSIALFETLD